MDVKYQPNRSKGNQMNERKTILIIIGLIAIALITFLVIYSITPRSTIALLLAPEEGFIAIDGGSKQPVENKQNLNVTPGKHTVEFSHSEFDSFSKEITIANKQTLEVIIILNPLTDAARQLLLTPGADEVIQRFTGEKMIKETDQLNKDYPILSILPIEARLYVVNACNSIKYPNNATKVALCADVYQEGLEPFVFKDITSRGYNPADYEIIFIDKYSPSASD